MTAIENIKVSQQAKDRLTKLKRVTGIKNWNVLCRWASAIAFRTRHSASGQNSGQQ